MWPYVLILCCHECSYYLQVKIFEWLGIIYSYHHSSDDAIFMFLAIYSVRIPQYCFRLGANLPSFVLRRLFGRPWLTCTLNNIKAYCITNQCADVFLSGWLQKSWGGPSIMESIHRKQGRGSHFWLQRQLCLVYPLVCIYHDFNADLALKTRGYLGCSFLAY